MSIIKVENLSKKYLISHESQERYTAMRDVLANKVKKLFSFPKSLQTPKVTKEEFYALKDINFEIEQGDRVGIIGRNGAGKSTLLKILSRITEPTTGMITINGRVASLLEVGTGFHPELTGRENIFLNGAILGMSRAEIRKKFDEIVDFAEVEKFLDTPVKRYSSGMYVRLAFAVAAHLEPEILIVDEVLAVGDIQFQKKCLGKMEDVSKNEGRTVLFVSHNMSAITNLCNKGMLLLHGEVVNQGDIRGAIDVYLNKNEDNRKEFKEKFVPGIKWWLNAIRMFQLQNETTYLNNNSTVTFCIDFEGNEKRKVSFEILIKDSEYSPVLYIPLGIGQNINFNCTPGKYSLSLDILMPHLSLGLYYMDVYIVESFVTRIAGFYNIFSFEVISSYVSETGWNFEKFPQLGNVLGKVNRHNIVKTS
jgi:lipopolysaccharide transport system ATP-binding protein